MLQQFAYLLLNYVDLTRLELNMILALSVHPPRKFARIGSGSLPLSSLYIADLITQEHGEKTLIHSIETHHRAIEQSSEMCCKLGVHTECLQFQRAEATAADGLKGYDVIYLAPLVGTTHTRECYLKSGPAYAAWRATCAAHCSFPPKFIIPRKVAENCTISKLGVYCVLIRPKLTNLSTEMASMDAERLVVMHPYNHLVNIIVICPVKSEIIRPGDE